MRGSESETQPLSHLFIALIAVKPQLNCYLYFNCTYESDDYSMICCEKILILYLLSEALESSSAVFREVGQGFGIAAALVQSGALMTVHVVVSALQKLLHFDLDVV